MPPPRETFLEVRGLSKVYTGASSPAVTDMDFALSEGEVLAVLGPSGCGKSTLLRLIAGLETPDAGDILLQGRPLAGVPAHERAFGLMFQDLALFPHLDVFENVAFGLRMRRWAERDIRERVGETLAFVRIPDFVKRRVDTLSGGERQRVALARSLAPRPRLLMLDEPLGALDRTLREELVEETRQLLRETGVTAVYVTHDQDEAFAVAERVLIMERGRTAQEGRPAEVYLQPASPFVARFLGHANLVPCRVRQAPEGVIADSVLGRWALPGCEGPAGHATLLVPPDALSAAPDANGGPIATVRDVVFREGRYRMRLTVGDGLALTMEAGPDAMTGGLTVGATVSLATDTRRVRLLPWGLE